MLSTFRVNTTLDTVAVDLKSGKDASGHISLRSAIQAADARGGSNTIVLPAGIFTLTIAGTGEDAASTGDLDITGNLTIKGKNSSNTLVDGNNLDRVFQVLGGKVSITNLTIQHGRAPGDGGGLLNSGGQVTLFSVGILNNVASGRNGTAGAAGLDGGQFGGAGGDGSAGTDGRGGGIFNAAGSLSISTSVIASNEAVGGDGGAGGNGGGGHGGDGHGGTNTGTATDGQNAGGGAGGLGGAGARESVAGSSTRPARALAVAHDPLGQQGHGRQRRRWWLRWCRRRRQGRRRHRIRRWRQGRRCDRRRRR